MSVSHYVNCENIPVTQIWMVCRLLPYAKSRAEIRLEAHYLLNIIQPKVEDLEHTFPLFPNVMT